MRSDGEARREQILAAAQLLFAKRSYHEVSTSELAAAAGTTRTNLHHHFGTKRDLYHEVVRRFAQLREPPSISSETTTTEETVRRMFDRWLDSVEHNRETYLSMIDMTSSRRDPEVEAALHTGMRAWEDRLLASLAVPETERNRALVRSFQAMVSAATDEWLRRDTLTRSDVLGLLTRALLSLRTGLDALA